MKQLQAEITAFLKERDWLDQYNHPKDLAISLSLEAAELLECFQWKTDEIALKENREELLKEVADVLYLCSSNCREYGGGRRGTCSNEISRES